MLLTSNYPKIIHTALIWLSIGSAQTGEIVSLSENVGTVIDLEENYFYGVFPDIDGFESAQFYEVNPDLYIARVVAMDYSRRKVIQKKYDLRGFFDIQTYVGQQPMITEEDRANAGIDISFLHGDKILSEIETGTKVTIRRKKGLWISGSLLFYEDHILHLKTLWGKRTVPIYDIKRIAYRESVIDRTSWKPYIYGVTAALGVSAAEAWTQSRDHRTEIVWFHRSVGVVGGLFFAPQLYRKINVIFTPKKSYTLAVTKH